VVRISINTLTSFPSLILPESKINIKRWNVPDGEKFYSQMYYCFLPKQQGNQGKDQGTCQLRTVV